MQTFFSKTLYQKRWMTLAWVLGGAALAGFTLAFFPTFKDSNLAETLNKLPAQLSSLVGGLDSFNTVTGYVGEQLFNLRLPLLTIILAISIFTNLTASDETTGTTAEQLTLPIARSRLLIEKYAAAVTIITLVNAAYIVAILTTLHLIHESLSLPHLLATTFETWLLALVFGALAFALGAATGSKGLTIGVASYVAFQSYLLTSLAAGVESLKDFDYLSPFHYYRPGEIMKHGLQWDNAFILIAFTVIFSLIGWLAFRRRDLKN